MITLIVESVEDQISWGRVIARSTDLYGKRSRHWSTADPIYFLVYISMLLLLATIGGFNYETPPMDQALDWNHPCFALMLNGFKLVLLLCLALFLGHEALETSGRQWGLMAKYSLNG